jgi:nicotinamide-nucleotide amidase
MTAEILCVGTELLLGDIVNTNAAYIAKELANLGIFTYYQTVVGDNPERLKQALDIALGRAELVIMTGGLGPTYDDLTKETVAEHFGRDMYMHEPSLDRITAFFKKVDRPMTENNKKQAMMPEGAVVFDNDQGTAPGLAVEGDGKIAIMLPGPPREMQPMFRDRVVPYLARFSENILVSKNIHIFGMGESMVEDRLKDIMTAYTNPTVAPYAKDGEVLLRVTASAKDRDTALGMIGKVIAEIDGRIHDVIYGIDVDSLQNALVLALKAKGLKVATAESCTGGYVAKRITEIPGSSDVFECGVCTYSNEMKTKLLDVCEPILAQYGAVSPITAAEMAKGVRKLSGADIGIGVTGIAGPGGGTAEKPVGLVYVGVDSDAYKEVKELRLSRGHTSERELIRYLASSHTLSLALKAAQKS